MANGVKLTASNIRYLVTLLRMRESENGVRCVDLADALGVTRPSVHKKTEYLCQMGLVEKGGRGSAFLTEQGKQTARRYAQCLDGVSRILKGQLPQQQDWAVPVTALLAEIPQEHIEAWYPQASAAQPYDD